ncbi:MAG TPA: hypothetical protein VK112_00860, partial [Fodinibius sp.]|nr:hypothetical protein [Fodinibius sp.]
IDGTPAHKVFPSFEKRRRKAFRNTVKRSELNMKLGRKKSHPALRNGVVSLMLNTPLSNYVAGLFTMRNIENGFI